MKKPRVTKAQLEQIKILNELVEDIRKAREESEGRMMEFAIRIIAVSRKLDKIEEKGK